MLFEPFRAVLAPWNSLSTASLNTFEGSMGVDSWPPSWKLSTENGMSYSGKIMLRYVIWTIQSGLYPGIARQLHLWIHLKDPSSNGGTQFAPKLGIVNWEWDVISRQNIAKVCHLNYSEPSWCPQIARQLHLWIHLKDQSYNGDRQFAPEWGIVNRE